MAFGPTCPDCGKRVPLMRTQWNLGKAFRCGLCDASIVVPRANAATMALGLFVAFWLLRSHFPAEWGGQIGLVVLLLAIGLPLTWAGTRVRMVQVADQP